MVLVFVIVDVSVVKINDSMGGILTMKWAVKRAIGYRNVFVHRQKRAPSALLAVSGAPRELAHFIVKFLQNPPISFQRHHAPSGAPPGMKPREIGERSRTSLGVLDEIYTLTSCKWPNWPADDFYQRSP
jgi:hypothetical protein